MNTVIGMDKGVNNWCFGYTLLIYLDKRRYIEYWCCMGDLHFTAQLSTMHSTAYTEHIIVLQYVISCIYSNELRPSNI